MSFVGEVSAVKSKKFKWTIKNFKSFDCKNVGEMCSPVFSATCMMNTKYKWQLSLGVSKLSKRYNLSISLHNLSDVKFTATVLLTFLNSENVVIGNDTIIKHTYEIKPSIFSYWTNRNSINRNIIENQASVALVDDKLTILCEIMLTNEEKKNQEATNKKRKYSQLDGEEHEEDEKSKLRLLEFDKYEHLIDDKEFGDVAFTVEGQVVQAHKCILVKSSPVFAAMFKAEMKEKQLNKVNIEDIKHSVFVEMLRFVYAGKVNDIETIAGELLAVADKYALDGLKLMCEKTLCENLSVDGVVQSLKLADQHRVDNLKTKAIEFIVTHAESIVNGPEFNMLGELQPGVTCEVIRALVQSKKQ